MIQKDAPSRITIDGVLKHPVFWGKEKILRFLSETSDCLEREDLDSKILVYLEMYKHAIGGIDWKLRLATGYISDLSGVLTSNFQLFKKIYENSELMATT